MILIQTRKIFAAGAKGWIKMSEYLERETAINIADHAILEHPYDKDPQRPETYSDYNQGWSDVCDYIRVSLTHVPAADVAPVRHGKWKDIFEYSIYCSDLKSTIELTEQKCNICRVVTTFKGAKLYLPDGYCPNCGARMDGEGKG